MPGSTRRRSPPPSTTSPASPISSRLSRPTSTPSSPTPRRRWPARRISPIPSPPRRTTSPPSSPTPRNSPTSLNAASTRIDSVLGAAEELLARRGRRRQELLPGGGRGRKGTSPDGRDLQLPRRRDHCRSRRFLRARPRRHLRPGRRTPRLGGADRPRGRGFRAGTRAGPSSVAIPACASTIAGDSVRPLGKGAAAQKWGPGCS